MIEFVPFDFQRHALWVKSRLNNIFQEDTGGIVAEKDGKPVGVMLAENWSDNSCNVHIGIDDPMCFKRKMHYEFCEWVFEKANRKTMYGVVPSNNKKVQKLMKHFGFREDHRLTDAYADGVDYVIYRYDKAECKYLDMKEAA